MIVKLPTRTEIAELIPYGENSYVEFKRDDLSREKLCKELASLLNLNGGCILLGVEDDGSVSGLNRDPRKAEEWVMEVARNFVRPAANPEWYSLEWEQGKFIGVISLPSDAPSKPYKAKRGSVWVTQVRVGTTTREATHEEEARLYMQGHRIQYDHKPVPNADLEDLDKRRLVDYFRHVMQQGNLVDDDFKHGSNLLRNSELMCEYNGNVVPNAAGILLFGKQPYRFFHQAEITAVAYTGTEKDYDARARNIIRGPLVSLFAPPDDQTIQNYPVYEQNFSDQPFFVESGVIEQAVDFVRRSINVHAFIDNNAQRQEEWDYPLQAVREAIVNAVVHRDYAIEGTDIELSIYSDRIEIISPGRLPNTVTVEKMRNGYRSTRNSIIKEVLRDYRYIEATGMGIPRKIIKEMQEHNETEVGLIESDDRFTVQLWKGANR